MSRWTMRRSVSRRPVEVLEGRVLLAANPVPGLKAVGVAARVNPLLLELHDDVVKQGRSAVQSAAEDRLQLASQDRVNVTVRANNVNGVTRALGRLGFQATASRPDLHFVEGSIPITSLRAVSKVSGVGRFGIQPTYAPMTMTGSVNSQADFVMEADRTRATAPGLFTGTGQKVGVLSNSYNTLGGAAADIASGDLPAAGVQVVQEAASIPPVAPDEGRAMLQLIHDLAPGASLAFATANGGEANFANNIRALANPAIGNSTVITDDVVYFAEPMFQDGVISQAIDEVVTTRGVNYFTSAGNFTTQGYESTNFQTAADTINFSGGGSLSGTFYDFNTGAGVDTRQRITVPANGQVILSFQWDDPWYTAGGVDTDLDLFLVNPATGFVVASAESDNLFFQDPAEIIGFTNPTAAPMALDLAILKFAGPNSGRIKYVNFGNTISFGDTYTGTFASTLVPHAGATNGQGVGAVPYAIQDGIENFTSKGGQTVLFGPTGAPIVAQTRNSPQIAAVDGTNNTFFGGSDFEGDGRPNFFGTSAAAPHAAAVAALVRHANPGITPAQVYTRLQNTADDITVSGVGFDDRTGFGLVNAFDAVYPTITPASIAFSDGLESGALSTAYETRSTGSGRILVTTANGPFAGTRHLTLDTSVNVGTPALNEVVLHVNASGPGTKTLSFRQREFADDDHPMTATFTGSQNFDGVALSVDGTNWHRIVSLTGAASTSTYTLNTFNLTAIAAAAGITLSSDTRIKFQQFDEEPIGGDGFAFDDIAVTNADATAPTVTNVFVAGTAWNAAYRNSLVTNGTGEAAFGYRIDATEQTRTMAWSNLNQVSVRFSEDVVVASNDLVVNGVNVASYGVSAFAYDPVTFTATWTLGQAIANDKVTINLDADAGTGVTDTAGNHLDGEWTNPVPPSFSGDTFPSGNGTAGGDFVFNLRVLPGDINRDGAVNIFDFNVLKPNLNVSGAGVLGGDINGDNVVNIFDFNDFKTNLGKSTPA